MNAATIHLAYRNEKLRRRSSRAAKLAAPIRLPRVGIARSERRLAAGPISNTWNILVRMPGGAICPGLLQLVELLSSPVLLTRNSVTRDREEPAAAVAPLTMVA